MAIVSISRDDTQNPSIIRLTVTDTLLQVATADYVLNHTDEINALNHGGWTWLESDVILVSASDGHQILTFDGEDFDSFVTLTGSAVVNIPVVTGHFASYLSVSGVLGDSGYLPSNASKTRVVMANGATQNGYVATFVDALGTVDDVVGKTINRGTFQAGQSGVAGGFSSFPSGVASGQLNIDCQDNAGDFSIGIKNASFGQSTEITLPDPLAATAIWPLIAGVIPVAGNIVKFRTATGVINDEPSTAVNLGDIHAGESGTSGSLIAYPPTAASGSISLQASDNSGDYAIYITNASFGQNTSLTLPDPGVNAAVIPVVPTSVQDGLMAKFSGTTGLIDDVPGFATNLGGIRAGQSGTAGVFYSFPITAASGYLSLGAADSAGDFGIDITNASFGQASVLTIPDPGAATAVIPLVPSSVANNRMAKFSGTTGLIDDTPGFAINLGIIQAGESGTPGNYLSYPPAAASGYINLRASNNAGNFAVDITNASFGQDTVLTIPDPLVVSANFALVPSAVVSGRLAKFSSTTGLVDDTAGTAVNLGDFEAGQSGTAGRLLSYPTAINSGILAIEAMNSAGNFLISVRNASFGQSSVLTIPDPLQATANVALAPDALVSGNLVMASGVSGLLEDTGYTLKAATANAVGGAAAEVFVDAFVDAGSVVTGNWASQANPAQIVTILPGAGSFTVTSTADAGVGVFKYVVVKPNIGP